jgi:hypothetical protein
VIRGEGGLDRVVERGQDHVQLTLWASLPPPFAITVLSHDAIHKPQELTNELAQMPEVIDDFIRNYLSAHGLAKSLDAFQNEWFEHKQTGRLAPEAVSLVPGVYQQNQTLTESLKQLRKDVANYKEIARWGRTVTRHICSVF